MFVTSLPWCFVSSWPWLRRLKHMAFISQEFGTMVKTAGKAMGNFYVILSAIYPRFLLLSIINILGTFLYSSGSCNILLDFCNAVLLPGFAVDIAHGILDLLRLNDKHLVSNIYFYGGFLCSLDVNLSNIYTWNLTILTNICMWSLTWPFRRSRSLPLVLWSRTKQDGCIWEWPLF